MENKELELIKKFYGEKLAKMCREMFPTLLEQRGLVLSILEKKFAHDKNLGEHIEQLNYCDRFKKYIFSFATDNFSFSNVAKNVTQKTAKELFDEAGYVLFPECKTKQDLMQFKKYYAEGEELCSFNGDRLDVSRVWFAIKKNVDDIKRENFSKPRRQDEYGTSVISIQFTKNFTTLSIKNRYNHMVEDGDATFSNNLDHIAKGLTYAFCRDYNITPMSTRDFVFDLPQHVISSNGKWFYYNVNIDEIYFCKNNVVIDCGEEKKFLSDRCLVAENYAFDIQKNTVKRYPFKNNEPDAFINSIGDIKNITICKDKNKNKLINIVIKNGANVVVIVNSDDEIIGYYNKNVETIGNEFLISNKALKTLYLPKLKSCGDDFLLNNEKLMRCNFNSLDYCGDNFLLLNKELRKISLPMLTCCGDNFLKNNFGLKSIEAPNLESCGDNFLHNNFGLTELNLPNLMKCGSNFINYNSKIEKINLNYLISCGNFFLYSNAKLSEINFPMLVEAGSAFMQNNEIAYSVIVPQLATCGFDFLGKNNAVTMLSVPNLIQCGSCFLYNNKCLKKLNAPKLKVIGSSFLRENKALKYFYAPYIEQESLINHAKKTVVSVHRR